MKIVALMILCLSGFGVPTVLAQETKDQTVLTGQVACSICWTEADRSVTAYGTKADYECAVACNTKRVPTVLAVTGGSETTMYQLEFGKLKKTKKGWLKYIAKRVEVSGTVRERNGQRYLKVNTLKVL